MPLLDHFVPPLSLTRPWEGFHSAWTTMMAQQLNRELPEGYVAIPQASRGPMVEIDVATLAEAGTRSPASPGIWSPSEPVWSGPLDWPKRDWFEIRIWDTAAAKLVGAIELVSPANKDRPSARQTFCGKCAGYLRAEIGLVVIDIVSIRRHDLNELLLELLELDHPATATAASDPPLTAFAYRTTSSDHARLEIWKHDLQIGSSLPILPLWLGADFAMPLDLEASYRATREMLRM